MAMQTTTELVEEALKAVSACVNSNGKEEDSSRNGGKKGPGEIAAHSVADREEEECASTLKKVESLKDADSITSTSSTFEEVDEMRFRNTLLEVLEELKMRRQQDIEAEESIAGLLDAKTTLEHLVEEGKRREDQIQEQLDRQEGEMRRSYEVQLKGLEAEKVKASSAAGVEEREVKALKDEVKILQMERLGLERKLKESERKVQMLASSRESILSQTAQLGQKCTSVKKQLDEATLQLENVEKSVHVAEERCQKLLYVNSHQECQLVQARRDLEQCRRRLLDAQVRSRGDSLLQDEGNGAVAAAKGNALRAAKEELKMERELTVQLEQQLGELKRDHQRVVAALCKAHKLVDSHVDCNVHQTERLSKLEEELEAVKGREEEAKSLLSTTMAELEQYKGRVDTEWQSKLAVTEDKLSGVQEELDLLRGRYQRLVEEHVQVVEARQALEQSAKGEASSLSHKLECLRCELSEKQQSLEAKEKEVEVERAGNQRRVLQLERAIDEKCKELQSLKAVLEDVTHSALNGQQKDEEGRDSVEVGTQTNFEACPSAEGVLVGTGDSQPKAVSFGDTSVGVVSPLVVPAPPLSPDLMFSPMLQCMSSDTGRVQVPVEVTEVEGAIVSGDLPTDQSVECDASKPPSQQLQQQDGRESDSAAQDSTPNSKGIKDSTALASEDVSPVSTHSKMSSKKKRPSPSQTGKGMHGVVSCKRVKQECGDTEEGEHCGAGVPSDGCKSGSGGGGSVQLGALSSTHEPDFVAQLCITMCNKPVAVSSQGDPTHKPHPFASSQSNPTHNSLPLGSSQGNPTHEPHPFASSQSNPTHNSLPLGSSQGNPTHEPHPFASSQGNPTHEPHPFASSQSNPTHNPLSRASSQGNPAHKHLPLASSQDSTTPQPLPLASGKGSSTHKPLPLTSSQHSLEHHSLPTSSKGNLAHHNLAHQAQLPPAAGEDDTVIEYQKNQITLSDSDDDIITSSLAESITSVQKFLKRDRLKCSKPPLFKM